MICKGLFVPKVYEEASEDLVPLSTCLLKNIKGFEELANHFKTLTETSCGQLSNRRKSIEIIHTLSLCVSFGNWTCFKTFNRAVRLAFYFINPLAVDGLAPWGSDTSCQVLLISKALSSASMAETHRGSVMA
jgi:hypothetical protein